MGQAHDETEPDGIGQPPEESRGGGGGVTRGERDSLARCEDEVDMGRFRLRGEQGGKRLRALGCAAAYQGQALAAAVAELAQLVEQGFALDPGLRLGAVAD